MLQSETPATVLSFGEAIEVKPATDLSVQVNPVRFALQEGRPSQHSVHNIGRMCGATKGKFGKAAKKPDRLFGPVKIAQLPNKKTTRNCVMRACNGSESAAVMPLERVQGLLYCQRDGRQGPLLTNGCHNLILLVDDHAWLMYQKIWWNTALKGGSWEIQSGVVDKHVNHLPDSRLLILG